MSKNDGGPIQPVLTLGDNGSMIPVGGLSLRDWFAGQIACGFEAIGDDRVWRKENEDKNSEGLTLDEWRKRAYAEDAKTIWLKADAMLAARDGKEGA